MSEAVRGFVASPVFGVALTVVVFAGATWLYRRVRFPLLHPVLVSIVTIIVVLEVFGVSYQDYEQGGSVVGFFLGPSVVALAIPLYRQRREIRVHALPIAGGIVAGGVVSVLSGVLIARLLGAGDDTLRSLAPKSATTPIAIGVSEKAGGIPSLTAAVVVATGILGAVVGVQFLRVLGVRSPFARGLALGSASHGVGTARAFEEGEVEGAASGLAIGLQGLFTALLVPLLLPLLLR